MNYESCEKQAPDIGIIWSLLVPGPASSCGLVPPGQGAKTSTLARGVGFCIWLHEAQFSQISWIATCTGPCCRGNSVARPADASKQRRVCSQTAGRLGGASAPRHIRRGPPRPTRRPGMANVSGACRAQESVTRLPSGRGAEGDGFGLRLLAGVFVTEGFAGCDGRRRDPWTCALWDRVFGRPGQTDAGWPKKVSRRVQELVTRLPSGRGAARGTALPARSPLCGSQAAPTA